MRGESSANGRNTFKIYVNETITFSFPKNYLSKTARIRRPSGMIAWRPFILRLEVCPNVTVPLPDGSTAGESV